MIVLFACALVLQEKPLTTPVPEPGKKAPVVKKAPAKPAPKPAAKPAATKPRVSVKKSPPPPVSKTPPAKAPKPSAPKASVATPVQIKFLDQPAGSGKPVTKGDVVIIHFTIQRRNGPELADTRKRGLPYTVKIGEAGNDPLLDLVLKGMKAGGTRSATIPARRAYGAEGAPPIILPNDTLLVKVTLLRRGDD